MFIRLQKFSTNVPVFRMGHEFPQELDLEAAIWFQNLVDKLSKFNVITNLKRFLSYDSKPLLSTDWHIDCLQTKVSGDFAERPNVQVISNWVEHLVKPAKAAACHARIRYSMFKFASVLKHAYSRHRNVRHLPALSI